jgi:hypothetical protein
MGLHSSDESANTSPNETMDLLQQRGSLRRLVREALPVMRTIGNADWCDRAEKLLSFNNWAEYEKR